MPVGSMAVKRARYLLSEAISAKIAFSELSVS
jgi:hypothetical protein